MNLIEEELVFRVCFVFLMKEIVLNFFQILNPNPKLAIFCDWLAGVSFFFAAGNSGGEPEQHTSISVACCGSRTTVCWLRLSLDLQVKCIFGT